MYTVRAWEHNHVSTNVSLMPKVIEFLGYIPSGNNESLNDGERIRVARRLLGLTLEEAATRLGVCVTTLGFWERGLAIPKKKQHIDALDALTASYPV